MAMPMFLRSRNSTMLFFIMYDASGRQKSKMTTHQQEILLFVSRHLGFLTHRASHTVENYNFNEFFVLESSKTWVLTLEFCSYDVYSLKCQYFRFIGHHFEFPMFACIAQYREQRHTNLEP